MTSSRIRARPITGRCPRSCGPLEQRGHTGTAINVACAVERLTLDPLALGDAWVLARHHLASRGHGDGRALAVAQEAGGHPLFIAELARHAGRDSVAPLVLDEALAARISSLEESTQALLGLLAVAGGPMGAGTLSLATGQSPGAYAATLEALRGDQLVRTGGDVVKTYHDRIRAAVLARMAASTRRLCHERIALALEAHGGADDELAVHWQGAGATQRAAKHAVRAADRAATALAFARAARFYRLALELDPALPDRAALSRRTHRMRIAARSRNLRSS